MRIFKLTLITLATLTVLGACAKQETTTTTATATEPTSVQREPEVMPPPEPMEAVPAETETVPDESTATTTSESPATPPSAQATPAPMLPRRGETAPASTPPPAQSAEDRHAAAQASQRITIADAYEIVRAGNGVLLDVRTDDAFAYQRIPGAIHIPLDQVAQRAKELPQDKWIITYCTCPAEESSGAAASTLTNMGFERVAALLGGMQGWRGQGLPVEFGQ